MQMDQGSTSKEYEKLKSAATVGINFGLLSNTIADIVRFFELDGTDGHYETRTIVLLTFLFISLALQVLTGLLMLFQQLCCHDDDDCPCCRNRVWCKKCTTGTVIVLLFIITIIQVVTSIVSAATPPPRK